MEKLVIIGAGQAAIQCINSLKKEGYSGEITLVGEEEHLPYQRPPLSKGFLDDSVNKERLYFKKLEFYIENQIQLKLGNKVLKVDLGSEKVFLSDQTELEFDKLVFGKESEMLKYSMANCCNPIPGDEIVGYITKGRGVTIHRLECKNIPLTKFSDRFIDVEWDFVKNTSFLIRLKIEIEDRKHLLKDLTESTSSMNINIKSVDISAEDGVAACLMIIEIVDIKQLNRLKNRIIKNIKPISIERM